MVSAGARSMRVLIVVQLHSTPSYADTRSSSQACDERQWTAINQRDLFRPIRSRRQDAASRRSAECIPWKMMGTAGLRSGGAGTAEPSWLRRVRRTHAGSVEHRTSKEWNERSLPVEKLVVVHAISSIMLQNRHTRAHAGQHHRTPTDEKIRKRLAYSHTMGLCSIACEQSQQLN
jgi:hypothetical protein